MRSIKSKENLMASGIKPTSTKYLQQEGQYSVFTTRNLSRFVLVCDQPFSGKLLNDAFQDIDDVHQLHANQKN